VLANAVCCDCMYIIRQNSKTGTATIQWKIRACKPSQQSKAICAGVCSDHIVAQQAYRYIVAFHIAISYDTQRPPYNGRAVGLPPMRCMYGLIWRTTVCADQCTAGSAACETHWMRRVSRRRRVRLMFDLQGQWQCAAETGTIYDGVSLAALGDGMD